MNTADIRATALRLLTDIAPEADPLSETTLDPSPAFSRRDFESGALLLGDGGIGGKAQGLVFFRSMLEAEYEPERFPGIEVGVCPYENASTTVARTQPLVVQPVTITVSTFWRTRNVMSGVWKNIDGPFLQ